MPQSPLSRAAAAAAGGALFLALGLSLSAGRDCDAKDVVVKSDKDGTKVRVVTTDVDANPVVVVGSDDDGGGSEGGAKRGFLGVDVDEDTKSDEGGALVNRVVEDSPAAKAGLKEGDVIVGFNGVVIRGPARLTEQIHAAKPGDTATLDVRRDGKIRKIGVTMGERPELSFSWNAHELPGMTDEQVKALEKSLKGLEKQRFELNEQGGALRMIGPRGRMLIFGMDKPLLGVELVETTPELRQAMGGPKDAGILVGKVIRGSAAETAGLQAGDLVVSVDDERVESAGDLASAIRDRAGKTADLEVVRDKRTIHVKAAIPELKEDEGVSGPSARLLPAPAPAAACRRAMLAPIPAPAAPPAPPAAPAPPAPPATPASLFSVTVL